jgi:hypothetical protein
MDGGFFAFLTGRCITVPGRLYEYGVDIRNRKRTEAKKQLSLYTSLVAVGF